MHPLRALLLVSLVIAGAVSWGLGVALQHAGATQAAAVMLGIVAFAAFMVPWTSVFVWAMRRARDLDTLTDRARAALEKPDTAGGAFRTDHAELDDLARSLEELRAAMVRERETHEEHRAAIAEILSSLGEGLVAVGPQGRIVFANAQFARLFASEGDLTGRPVLEVARRQPVVAALDSALRGAPAFSRLTVSGGSSERQIEVRAVPVASKEIAAVALFIDITTIEQLQRVRREFLDDFSHEVRTPLAGLQSAAETLQHGLAKPEHEEQLRQVMQRQISRIGRLVDEVSELNRIETGEIVLEKRVVGVREMLLELSQDFEARSAGAPFVVAGENITAMLDPGRAQQIFTNIFDNARKHGGDDGRVLVSVAQADGEVVVRVSDEGPGIPQAELERIFHRFYRVDRSRSQPGTGLGLAIAKHLVVAHGGTIRASNRPAGGATFEIRLPLS